MKKIMIISAIVILLSGCSTHGTDPNELASSNVAGYQPGEIHHLVGPKTGRLVESADVDRKTTDEVTLVVDGLDLDSLTDGDQVLVVVVQVIDEAKSDQVGFFDVATVTGDPVVVTRDEREVLSVSARWQTEADARGETSFEGEPGYFRYDPATERVLVVPIVTIADHLSLPAPADRRKLVGQMGYVGEEPEDPAITDLILTPPQWNPGGHIFVDPNDSGGSDVTFDAPFAGGVLAIDVEGTLTLGEGVTVSADGAGFAGGLPSPRAADKVVGGGYYGEDAVFRLQEYARPNEDERRQAGGPGWTGPEARFPGGGGGGGGLQDPGGKGGPPRKGSSDTAGGPAGTALRHESNRSLMGSGGGGAGSGAIGRQTADHIEAEGGRGGAGGGLIYIRANRIVFSGGTVSSRGLDGTQGNHERLVPSEQEIAATGGGGGASGGTVWLVGRVTNWPDEERIESVRGGAGGPAGQGAEGRHGGDGGNGGSGYAVVERP